MDSEAFLSLLQGRARALRNRTTSLTSSVMLSSGSENLGLELFGADKLPTLGLAYALSMAEC